LLVVIGSQSYLYLAILPLITFYLWLESRWHAVSQRQHISRILLALTGFGFDSLITSFGLIGFNGEQHSGFALAPIWLALMWLWFAITFSTCYSWLVNRAYLAILFATAFGPTAYWGASYISSVIILRPMVFTGISMFFWGGLFAIIFARDSLSHLLIQHPTSLTKN